jgi:lipopolysaccharide/colanic/teichoic acid biosynthesis glycosyltransferase
LDRSTFFVSPSELAGRSRRVRLVPSRARGPRPRTGDEERERAFPILCEELFGDALVRERRRADRFEQAFAVVLLTATDNGGDEWWKRVRVALSQAAADTDLVGWYEQNVALALMRPLVDASLQETATGLAARVRRDLGRHLRPEDLNSCSIRCEIYSPITTSSPLLEVTNRRQPQRVIRVAAKRLLDIIGSSVLLITLAPVLLIVSALVKLTSRGPVLFPQERIGSGGRPFTMMKFRTMHLDADPRIHQQYVENFIQAGEASGTGERVFKIVNDPRVTPIGRFLRRSSLDELPQFWNVLKGDMSLVGPRPPLPYEVARYKNWHRRRVLEAKPGLTGLWQVTGRSRTTFDEMVRLDLRYAKNYSVWTDLKILMATPRAVISGKGAH